MTFQIGDVVICTKSKPFSSTHFEALVKGQEYVITKVSEFCGDVFVQIDGYRKVNLFANRFELKQTTNKALNSKVIRKIKVMEQRFQKRKKNVSAS
jgi:hypothetical protein